ncbi:MFS transporter [Bacillus sp. AFS053548]|uniref:MDR family MFS transporter n=1 Tax=Bacillus sp. AFS053548 TaxID=2033505 RepID=UPI000BFE648D|nr:MFS transporter [Bacillus sp. AFS053548]PGM52587.1 MFS transporter [Bacillus sp. AFS053548]
MFKNLSAVHPVAWNIVIGTLFVRFASTVSMPFLAIYLTSVKHISPAMVGLMLTVSSFLGVFFSFIGGTLSDRIGRKTILLSSIFLWSITLVGFGLGNSFVWFFVLNSILNICSSFFEPSSRALLSDLTDEKSKLLVFNLRYAAINVGVAVGPLVGLYLGSSKSTLPFVLSGIVYFFYGLTLLFMLSKYKIGEGKSASATNKVSMKASFSILRKDIIFALTILTICFYGLGYSQSFSTMSQYFANAPQFHNGIKLYAYLTTINAVTVVILQFPIVSRMKNFSPTVSMMIGNVIVSLAVAGFGLFTNFFLLALVMIVLTVGEIFAFTFTDVFVDQLAPEELKGTYFGAMGFSKLGFVFGPALGGSLLAYFGYENGGRGFVIISAIAFISFPMMFFVNRLFQKRNAVKVESDTKLTVNS